MTVQQLIDYIQESLNNNNINIKDAIYINIDYMHYRIKNIYNEIDKIVFQYTIFPKKSFLSIEQILEQLMQIQNKNLSLWIRMFIMFQPANYFEVINNQINILYDINFDLTDIED